MQARGRELLVTAFADVSSKSRPTAVALARIPEKIRGFGHIKGRHVEAADAERAVVVRAIEFLQLDEFLREGVFQSRHRVLSEE